MGQNEQILMREIQEQVKCRACGGPILSYSELGLCKTCSHKKEYTGKHCTEPGCNESLGRNNKSGLCKVHYQGSTRAKNVHRQYFQKNYVSYKKIQKKKKKGKIYKRICWYCKKELLTDSPHIRLHDKCRPLHFSTAECEGETWMSQWSVVNNNYREERTEY